MHRSLLALLLLPACSAEVKPDPAPPAGSGNVISASGGEGSSSDTSTSSSSSSDSSSSTTSEESVCEESGQSCGGDGICIDVGGSFLCGHLEIGDPCELDDHCHSLHCFAQAASEDIPGVCTGGTCDRLMAECEADGICVMASNGDPLCSHGQVGEPCTQDTDCDGGRCQEYADPAGNVLVCA